MQKMERAKEGGEEGEKRKCLQTNPWIFKTAHLAFHARVHTLKFHAVIHCF